MPLPWDTIALHLPWNLKQLSVLTLICRDAQSKLLILPDEMYTYSVATTPLPKSWHAIEYRLQASARLFGSQPTFYHIWHLLHALSIVPKWNLRLARAIVEILRCPANFMDHLGGKIRTPWNSSNPEKLYESISDFEVNMDWDDWAASKEPDWNEGPLPFTPVRLTVGSLAFELVENEIQGWSVSESESSSGSQPTPLLVLDSSD